MVSKAPHPSPAALPVKPLSFDAREWSWAFISLFGSLPAICPFLWANSLGLHYKARANPLGGSGWSRFCPGNTRSALSHWDGHRRLRSSPFFVAFVVYCSMHVFFVNIVRAFSNSEWSCCVLSPHQCSNKLFCKRF